MTIYRKLVKRTMDMCIALVFVPVVAILAIPIGIAIKCEDGGTVFYGSQRLGRDRRPFRMWKFRTMKMNAPDIRNADGTTYNAVDDPRLTRIGKLLRVTSIDELPQIINVCTGDMSLVGPRPSPLGNESRYPRWYLEKFSVRPGITGLSQVRFRNSGTLEDRYRSDVEYARNVSFLGDLSILGGTAVRVLKRKGVFR